MPEGDTEAIEGFSGRICLSMPNGLQSVPYVDLRDICDGHLAQLRQNMQLKWRKPPSGLAITLQFRLATFESVQRHIGQTMQIAFRFAKLPLPFFDRVPCRAIARQPSAC